MMGEGRRRGRVHNADRRPDAKYGRPFSTLSALPRNPLSSARTTHKQSDHLPAITPLLAFPHCAQPKSARLHSVFHILVNPHTYSRPPSGVLLRSGHPSSSRLTRGHWNLSLACLITPYPPFFGHKSTPEPLIHNHYYLPVSGHVLLLAYPFRGLQATDPSRGVFSDPRICHDEYAPGFV